jgi:multisubunit Na+/H+ antiporter MnhC subunit
VSGLGADRRLQLRQPRDVGGLYRDSLRVFLRHAWLFILLSAAVVIPVEVAVEGIGLEMLTSSYDESPPLVESAVPTVVSFEAFTPLFGAVVLAALGIALGFLALVVPGVYLAVRWYFVPQTVVIENARGPAALTRSGQTVQGFWWRTFGLVLLANVAVAIPGFLLLSPFSAIAASTDRAVWALVGTILATSVTTPFVALYSTLLYYDLLARRTAAH